MGQREFEVLGDELFDVWSSDVVGLCDFDDFEDLGSVSILNVGSVANVRECS